MSTQATLRSDIESFRRLHAARWRGRGRSTFVSYGHRAGEMLNGVKAFWDGLDRDRLEGRAP